MKAMRKLPLWVAVITLGGFAACNTTVGECWYYGEGTENAAAGVGPGGGVIVPTGPAGVGGAGDGPPKQPQDAPDRPPPPECNEEEDDAIELSEVHCGKIEWGVDCMIRCGTEGVACYSHFKHPYTPEVGMGLLWKCCGCKGQQQCKYIYDNGDECTILREKGNLAYCKYIGGK